MKGVRSSQALARQSASLQRRWASQFSSAQAGGLNIAASEETAAPTSAITVALRAGPRYESSPGAAHVLKNYMFRSTDKRSALRLIREAEIYGGVLSSSLSREHLFLTAEFLKGDESYFAEVLGDAISRAKLQAHEYKEDVVSQAQAEYEQAMHNAQAVALDNLHQLAFRTGLGNSIYASPDISVSHQQAVSYANQALGSSSNMAVIADNIRSSTLKSLVGEHFDVKASSTLSAPASQYYGGEARINFHGENLLSVGFKAGPLADPAYLVLQHLLGGEPAVKWTQGTSNFAANANGAQSFYYGYSDAGIIGFNVAAADPSKTSEIAQKAVAQIKRVASGDVKDEEVKRAISKAKFAAASTLDHRLSALEVTGAQLLAHGKSTSLGDTFAALDKVSSSDVAKAASDAVKSKPSVVAVGNARALPYADQLGL